MYMKAQLIVTCVTSDSILTLGSHFTAKCEIGKTKTRKFQTTDLNCFL